MHAARDHGGFVVLAVDGVEHVVDAFSRTRANGRDSEHRLDVAFGDEIVHHAHVALGVDVQHARAHHLRLRVAHGGVRRQDLAVHVGDAHEIQIHERQRAHAAPRQRLHGPAPDPAHAQHDDVCVGERGEARVAVQAPRALEPERRRVGAQRARRVVVGGGRARHAAPRGSDRSDRSAATRSAPFAGDARLTRREDARRRGCHRRVRRALPRGRVRGASRGFEVRRSTDGSQNFPRGVESAPTRKVCLLHDSCA